MGEKMELQQQSIPILLAGEACSNLKEEKEARRGEGVSKMVTVHIDEARQGSFNAFLWVQVWVLGEALCFQG